MKTIIPLIALTSLALSPLLSGCLIVVLDDEEWFPEEEEVCDASAAAGINITVEDEEGQPISDATVVAKEGDSFEEPLESFADSGHYAGVFERAGTYSVQISKAGYEPLVLEDLVVKNGVCHVISISKSVVLIEERPPNCDMIVVAGLVVTVTDEEGDPITDATVTGESGDYWERLEHLQNGRYLGAWERAGTYVVRVERNGFKTQNHREVRVFADECHVIPISLSMVLISEERDCSTSDGMDEPFSGMLKVIVVDEAGEIIEDAKVSARESDRNGLDTNCNFEEDPAGAPFEFFSEDLEFFCGAYGGLENMEGRFTIRVNKVGYETETIEDIQPALVDCLCPSGILEVELKAFNVH